MNFFKKQKSTISLEIPQNLHSWRFIGEVMEALGTRLDAARASLKNARTAWAQWYWQETMDRLMIQWKSLPILHDGEAQMALIPRWTVDYQYYENSQELSSYGIDDKLFDKTIS